MHTIDWFGAGFALAAWGVLLWLNWTLRLLIGTPRRRRWWHRSEDDQSEPHTSSGLCHDYEYDRCDGWQWVRRDD